MRLGFDIDEVIVDLTKRPLEIINEEFDTDFTLDIQKTYIIGENVYTGDAELDRKIGERFLELICDDELTEKAPAVKDASKYLKLFKKQGHQIYLVSHRPKRRMELTVRWLRKHKIPFDKLMAIGLEGQKGPYGRIFNLDMFVDDLMPNLENMYKYKNRWRKGLLLLDKPWNRDYIDTNKAIRVYNWKEINTQLGINNR